MGVPQVNSACATAVTILVAAIPPTFPGNVPTIWQTCEKKRGAIGEANPHAKLNASIVRAILASDESQQVLGDRYGVSQTTVLHPPW